MSTGRKSAAATIALAIIPLLLLVAYAVGYFWLSDPQFHSSLSIPSRVLIEREYSEPWMVSIFGPAAAAEGKVRGIEVHAKWHP